MFNDFAQKKEMLVMFDALVDVDFGIAKVIENEFKNSDFIDTFLFDNCDERIITYLLERESENVLSVIVKPEYDYNDIYEELWDSYRYKIYQNARMTSIINMISVSNKLDNLSIRVVCSNEMELDYITDNIGFINGSINTIAADVVDVNDYDGIIYAKLSDFEKDIPKFNKDVNIYILKARYNLDLIEGNFLIKKHIIEKYPEHLISIMEPYIMTEEFFMNG